LNTKTQKWYVYCGLIGNLVMGVGALIARLIPLPSPRKNATQVASFYLGHTTQIRVGLMLAMLGLALFGPWIAVITTQIKRIEGPNSPSAYCELALGGILILEGIFPLMFLEVAVFRSDRSPAEIQLMSDLCWLMFWGVGYTYLVELIVTSVAIYNDKREQPIFPRWYAGFNVLAAVVIAMGCFSVLTKVGPFAWNGIFVFGLPVLIYFPWVVVTSVLLLKAVDSEAAEQVETFTAPAALEAERQRAQRTSPSTIV